MPKISKDVNKRIGVVGGIDLLSADLKREALLFDVLATDLSELVEALRIARSLGHDNIVDRFMQRASYVGEMRKSGVLIDLNEAADVESELKRLDAELVAELRRGMIDRSEESVGDDDLVRARRAAQRMAYNYPRRVSQILIERGCLAVPIYQGPLDFASDFRDAGSKCLTLVIRALPQLSPNTDWSQIADFRNDPDSQRKLRALHDWQNEISHADLKPHEIADKIAHLLDDYTEHMKLHHLKYDLGTVEMVVTTGAEVLEGLLRFKPTKIVSALFSFGKRELDLKEAELRAPGREVAFIYKARQEFGIQD